MSSDSPDPFVVDNGSQNLRVGFAGDDAPRYFGPTCLIRANKTRSEIALMNHLDYQLKSILPRSLHDKYPDVLSAGEEIEQALSKNLMSRNKKSSEAATNSVSSDDHRDVDNDASTRPRKHASRNMVGAARKFGASSSSYYCQENPIQHGTIRDFEAMEAIWYNAFANELKTDTVKSVLMTEKPGVMKQDRERMTQIAFENFNFDSFYVAHDAVLAIYASGRTTGMIVDSGFSTTTVAPIYEGYILPQAVQRSYDICGQTVDLFLKKLLLERGLISPMSGFDFGDDNNNNSGGIMGIDRIVRGIKERCCFLTPCTASSDGGFDLPQNYQRQLDRLRETDDLTGPERDELVKRGTFELPDNSVISLIDSDVRFLAPECLFFPRQLLDPGCGYNRLFTFPPDTEAETEQQQQQQQQNNQNDDPPQKSETSERNLKKKFINRSNNNNSKNSSAWINQTITTSENFLKFLNSEAQNCDGPPDFHDETNHDLITNHNNRNDAAPYCSFGLHHLVQKAQSLCDVDIRNDLIRNIVVAGGNTMFDRFGERLEERIARIFSLKAKSLKSGNNREANQLFYEISSSTRPKVVAPPERFHSVWIGGSILASLSTFASMWVTKEEYDETGPSIVHRKCF